MKPEGSDPDPPGDLTLEDGRVVCIRPVVPSDRATYAAAVAALSAEARFLRFAGPMQEMDERLLDRMMQVDGHRHVAYAALTLDGATGVGVARYVVSTDDPGLAEVAFTVSDGWRRLGLGTTLLDRLILHAGAAGLRALVATTLAENLVAARLLRSAGFGFAGRAGTSVDYRLPLPAMRTSAAG